MAAFSYEMNTPHIKVSLEDICSALMDGNAHALSEWAWKQGSPLPAGILPSFEVAACVLLIRIGRQGSLLGVEDLRDSLGFPKSTRLHLGLWVDPSITDETLLIRAIFVGGRPKMGKTP